MSQAISENVSETKPGRPPVLDSTIEQAFEAAGLFVGLHSRRSRLNVFYRQRALGVLIFQNSKRQAKVFKWLADGEKMTRGEAGAWRQTILFELGRIADDELLKAVAARICELKPKTREAITMIRRVRTGDLPLADTLQLANQIIQTINVYMQAHSGVSKEQVFNALNTARQSVDESLS